MAQILIIEDEDLLGEELLHHFRKAGWDAVRASTLAEARTVLLQAGASPEVVLSDMSLPDGKALDLLEEVRQSSSTAGMPAAMA